MATTTKVHIEQAHDLAPEKSEFKDEELEIPDLFVCLTECYVYAKPGDNAGNPLADVDILYDTVPDEIIQLKTENRKGQYVECELPVPGWVYLPDENREYDWGDLDELYKLKKEQAERERKEDEEDSDDDDPAGDAKQDDQKHDDMQHLTALDENYDEEKDDDDDYDATLIETERRKYNEQRMMMQTKPPDLDDDESTINKLMQIKLLKNLAFFFRRHTYLPGLIVLIIQAVIECFILFDVVSDIRLALELQENLPMFTASMACICAPYIIAWTACSQMGARRLAQNPGNCWYVLAIALYDIPPIGIGVLLAVDLIHWVECVFVKPLFFLVTGGKNIRTISYEELGYYKLRRVSEIFAEALPQALIQLFILAGGGNCYKCTLPAIIMALCSSVFILCLWMTIILLEGKMNGMGFVEYTCVIFQGSFDFVPLLPAIERGTKNGKKVNWTYYKLSTDGCGHVAKALNLPVCKLNTLKISKYTLKDLHRPACKYLGGTLQSKSSNKSKKPLNLIISRREEDILALFKEYDADNSKSLDFEEFVHLCLIIKKKMKEACLRSDVFLIYEELADSVAHEVWLLDLILKIRGSKARIGLLDYDLPLRHAYEESDLKMMSLLMAYEYDKISADNEAEFEYCVSDALTNGKTREALCLCEHKGIPLVVRMESGKDLLPMDDDNNKSDPYVRVSIFEQMKMTKYRKETLNPIWYEDLVFIVPFEYMDRLLHLDKFKHETTFRGSDAGSGFIDKSMTTIIADNNKSKANKDLKPQKRQKPMHSPMASNMGSIFNSDAAANDRGRGQSFAAIDINSSTITGYKLPAYCEFAIKKDLRDTYKKNFNFNYIGSVMDLNKAVSIANNNNNYGSDMKSDSNIIDDDNAIHKPQIHYGNKSGKLTIRFRVFDHDLNEEDDYMGSYKTKIIMGVNTEKYHERKQTVNLQPPVGFNNAGNISYRVFLNAVQIYQDHSLHYIDELTKEDKPIEMFNPKITDEPVMMQDVFHM